LAPDFGLSMPYAVTCKACGARFSVADDLYKKRVAGKSVLVNCKQCRAPIRIDASEAPPARRSSARPPSATRQFPSRPPVPQGPARPAPSRLPSIQRTHLGGLTARGAPAAPGSRAAQPPTANAPAAPSPPGAPKATLQGLTAPRAGGQAAPQAPKAAPQGATKATLQGLSAPKAAPSPPRPRGGNLPLIPQAGPHLADADEEADEEATIPFGAYFDMSAELESVPPSAGPNSVDLTEDAEALPPSMPHTALLARGRDPHPPLKAEPARKTSTGGSIEDDPDFLLGLDNKSKTTQDGPPTQRRGSTVASAPRHEHPHPPSPPAPPVAAAASPSPIVAVTAAASPPTATPSPSAATTAPAPATVSKPIQPPSAAPKPPAPAASRTPQTAAETLRMDAVKLDAPRLDAPSLYDKGQATSSALALPTTDPSAQSKRSSSWGAVLGLLVLLVGLGGVYRYLNPSAEPQAAAPPAQPATPEPPAPKVEAPPAPTVATAPATAAAPEPAPEPAAPPAAAPATPEPAAPATKPAAPSYASPSPAPAAPREPSKPTSATEKPAPTPATTKPSSGKPPRPTGPVGPFDRAAAASALSSAASQASSCKKSGDPSGTASVTVTFAPSGRVTSANISGPPFAGTATGGCIASTLRRATIPPFEGDRITVSKTVVIR
jgi:hypothetical protein